MKYATFTILLLILATGPSDAAAGRYIPGQAQRIGVRNAAMGGNHTALLGDLSSAFHNPASILYPENATLFGAEGFLASGPTFETRDGQNVVEPRQDSPPLLIGFSTTYRRDFAFAIVDGLRYDARYSGALFALDEDPARITDFQEEVRLSTTGLVVAARAFRDWIFGLGLYYDRQKVFKRVDYTVAPEYGDDYPDYEAFGTATALHGGFGIHWTKSEITQIAIALQTSVDLRNNLTVHTFPVNIVPTPEDPNSFFRESQPVSDDNFPWSITLGGHRVLGARTDLYGDVAYVGWGSDENRSGLVTASVGGEWRADSRTSLRAGLYTQTDPSDYGSSATLSEADARLLDLRSPTTSAYSDGNSEVFLTGGVGLRLGYFRLNGSVEDSHLLSDYGRTIVKLGFTAALPSAATP